MKSTTQTTLPNINMTLVESYQDVQKFFTWLGQDRSILAVDTETTGLSFISDKIRLVQFGDASGGFAFDWNKWAGVVHEVFKVYEGDYVFHNASFDIKFLEHYMGIRLPRERIHDTMIMSRLMNHGQGQPHGLKPLVGQFVDPRMTVGQAVLDDAMKKNKWTWATVPLNFEAYWGYGVLDTIATAMLYNKFYPRIASEGYEEVYELEMSTLMIAVDMELKGIRVDLDYCNQKYDELTKYSSEVKEYVFNEYGVSPGSAQQITKILIRDGVPLDKRTAGGNLSFDIETIERFKDAHPLINTIYNYKKAVKLSNTYFLNFIEQSRDGRIHASINTCKAVTGRSSIVAPALQTLSRGDIVRRAFIPDEGCLFQSIDFSAIELRIVASLSGDTTMINLFKDGVDLHSYLAKRIYNTDVITKEQRTIGKNASFSRVYGAGVRKFSETAKITYDEAKLVYDTYEETFPMIGKFTKQIIKTAEDNYSRDGESWLRLRSGRKFVVDQGSEFKLGNYVVQGTAAEELKRTMIRLQAAGYMKYVHLPIHDELVMSLPKEDAVEIQNAMMEIMTDRDTYAVPLTVEAGTLADNWADSK
jgi:DNA polymerase I-like protein with 3'-5' exonuclease and polymerase domains